MSHRPSRRRAGPGRLLAVWLLLPLLASCTTGWPGEPRPDPRDRVPIDAPPPRPEGAYDDDDDEGPIDWSKWGTGVEERFPGLRRVDFFRTLVTAGKGSGRCRAEVAPPWDTKLEIEWRGRGKTRSASGFRELRDAGWWPIYRTPEGTGIELRKRFTALDVTLETELRCRCETGSGTEDAVHPVKVRFRWTKGDMPEVSGGIVDTRGRFRGLPPGIVYGHLLTYQFAPEAAYPGRRARECRARVDLSILGDPPIL